MPDPCPGARFPTPLPSPVPPDILRQLVDFWGLHPELACLLADWREQLGCIFPAPIQVYVISGKRTREHQECLRRLGRPTADPDLSTHIPATTGPYAGYSQGVDIDIIPQTEEGQRAVGVAAGKAGLRWGGGSKIQENGIPSDWNHLDMGPKRK